MSKCCYCLTKFSRQYIECAQCENIVLCINCFSCGVEGGSHKNSHDYYIKKKEGNDKISIFTDGQFWSVEEETKLLQGIEIYGFGNWEDVSHKVDSRSPEECMNHYITYYVSGVLNSNWLTGVKSSPSNRVHDHTQKIYTSPRYASHLSPTKRLSIGQTNADLTPEEQLLLGFMSKREDFERDYDNDAESIICKLGLSVGPRDELIEALSVAQISIYTHRLKERDKRKQIALEHGLIPHIMAEILNKKPTLTPNNNTPRRSRTVPNSCHSNQKVGPCRGGAVVEEEPNKNLVSPSSRYRNREKHYDAFHIAHGLKPYFRYLSSFEGRQLLTNLEKEKRLRAEISELCNLRKNGHQKIPKYSDPPKLKRETPNNNKIVKKKKRGFRFTMRSPLKSRRHAPS